MNSMIDPINDGENQSLSELDWRPGMLMGFFDHTEPGVSQSFLLTLPTRIVRGHSELDRTEGELRLIFAPRNGEREEWTLLSRDKYMELRPPKVKWDVQVPHYKMLNRGYPPGNPYVVESVYAGQEAIERALEQSEQGMKPYAKWLRSGRLCTQRGSLGNWIERKGFEILLPNKLKFKG